jgi:hypothetical protein
MFARTIVIVALTVVGCRTDQPLERLPAPVHDATFLQLAPPPRPPPPPPPPPGHEDEMPPEPPRELQAVLEPQREPPVVMLFELTERGAEDAFLGYGIAHRKKLETADAKELLLRLAEPDAFVDGGDCGCAGDPLGVHIVHGEVSRDVVVECGHMYFTPSRRDGRFVLLARATAKYIDSLR